MSNSLQTIWSQGVPESTWIIPTPRVWEYGYAMVCHKHTILWSIRTYLTLNHSYESCTACRLACAKPLLLDYIFLCKKNCMLRLHAYILAHVFDAQVIMYFYQDHNSPLSRRCIEIYRDPFNTEANRIAIRIIMNHQFLHSPSELTWRKTISCIIFCSDANQKYISEQIEFESQKVRTPTVLLGFPT